MLESLLAPPQFTIVSVTFLYAIRMAHYALKERFTLFRTKLIVLTW